MSKEALEALDRLSTTWYTGDMAEDWTVEGDIQTIRAALTPQHVDMSSLRKEIFLHDDFSLTMQAREAVYWVLDHLAARGLIVAPPPSRLRRNDENR